MTPSSTAAANSASRGRSDQTFSAACPNSEAKRSSSERATLGRMGSSRAKARLL